MDNRINFLSLLVIVFVSSTLLVFQVSAQDNTRNLTLHDAIEATLKNNKDIQLAKLDREIATLNFEQSKEFFLPKGYLSYTAMSTNNPLNAFGFKLQQGVITPNDFNPEQLNHPAARQDVMTRLEIEQPLINMQMLYMRKGAEKQIEVYQYKTQREREYMAFQAKKAYLQLLLAYKAIKVLTETEQSARSVYTFTFNHFKQGLVQRSDLLNAQVHVSSIETSLAKAESNLRNASDYLSLLMGEPGGVIYKVEDETQGLSTSIDSTRKITANRSDFMAMQKAIEASGLMIKSSQMSHLPKLNAFGNYQFNDNHITGFAGNAYLVGIQLLWNVFDGNKAKHMVAAQKLEQDKLVVQLAKQKEQSQVELDKAYRDLSDAYIEMEQEKTAIEQAAEALRILLNRYQQGLVNTTDVLAADTQLSQLKFSLFQVQFTANLTRAYIELLTSTTSK